MRTLVEPAPASHCPHCGGELRVKLIKPHNHALDMEHEILVCVNCGREWLCTVPHDHYAPLTKVA